MNERPVGHSSDHARHDRLLVVRSVAGDVQGADSEQARALIDNCSDCAALAADMLALRSSMAALPAPRRTRNFQISAEKAEELRGSAFERLLRRLAMPKLAILRPVAGVGVALGLTVAVVGSGLPASYMPAAGAPAPQALEQDAAATATAADRNSLGSATDDHAPTYAESTGGGSAAEYPTYTAMPASAPSASAKGGGTDYLMSALPTASGDTAVAAPATTSPSQPEQLGPTARGNTADTGPLLLFSGLLLAAVALGLLLLSIYARRRTEDPLLR